MNANHFAKSRFTARTALLLTSVAWLAMTTGLEPVPPALTGQCTLLLCYVTWELTLWRRDSNPDQLVNSQRPCRWTTPEW